MQTHTKRDFEFTKGERGEEEEKEGDNRTTMENQQPKKEARKKEGDTGTEEKIKQKQARKQR